MNFDELNEDNYLFFAIKHYNNPQAVTKEDFYDDLKRFKYLKRLLKTYLNSGVLKLHLILNHLIIIYNVFGEAAILKAFMLYMSRYPEIYNDTVMVDQYCLTELNKL
jgi:hypothetical protein